MCVCVCVCVCRNRQTRPVRGPVFFYLGLTLTLTLTLTRLFLFIGTGGARSRPLRSRTPHDARTHQGRSKLYCSLPPARHSSDVLCRSRSSAKAPEGGDIYIYVCVYIYIYIYVITSIIGWTQTPPQATACAPQLSCFLRISVKRKSILRRWGLNRYVSLCSSRSLCIAILIYLYIYSG